MEANAGFFFQKILLMTWVELQYQLFAFLEMGGEAGRRPLETECVVVYAPGHLGDFLQLTPMLRFLRERLPESRIVWLIGVWTMEVATRYTDWADEIMVFSPQKETLRRHGGKGKQSVLQQWFHLRQIRQQGVGILIGTMPEDPIARFVANALRPRVWVGVGDHRPPRVRKDIETVMLPFEKDIPEAVAQLKLAERACEAMSEQQAKCGPPPSLDLEFPIKNDERAWAKGFLFAEGVDGKPLVLLAPGSGWSGKNWAPQCFAELAERLLKHGLAVAWTGGASEHSLCAGPGHNWTGRLTLGQLGAVMERAVVWVGNDSGPMHVAVAVGCRTVSLWGPTNENKWGGMGEKHVKIRGADACPGFIYWNWKRKCPKPGHPCMEAITVDFVERKVLDVIYGKRT